MSKKLSAGRRRTVASVEAAMEAIAPTVLAQDWDHVGLMAGDPAAAVKRMVKIEREYTPHSEISGRYDELYALYRELIEAVWPVWERSFQIGLATW